MTTSSNFQDVTAFHRHHGINYEGKPRSLDFDLLQFRLKFLREELGEFEGHADQLAFAVQGLPGSSDDRAEVSIRLANCLDALCDLVYVALGTAHLMGLPFDEAWKRVHAANMAKSLGSDEKSFDARIRLKLEKPPEWQAPDHTDLVEDNVHVG